MKDLIRSTIKKVTLELVYEVVDERTRDIKERLGRLEGDMRDLRHETTELRSDMNRRFEGVQYKKVISHKRDYYGTNKHQ